MANKISAIIDVQADKAKSLKKFRTELKETEGGFNKLKKIGGASFGAIKQNAGAMAMGAGTAIIGFAAKSVMAFNETAIAAGNFADSTGLAVEDASRWMSVADDMGLNADTMQKSFLKLNKEIATGSAIQKEYGIESVLAADGQIDVNETMLKAIDTIGGIQDPTKRAMVAQQMFGRSYAEVAEIVLGDAEKIRAGLEGTSDAQVIDEDEVRKAREMRRAMDELNDILSDVTLSLGEHLTPAITDAVDDLKTFGRAIGEVNETASGIPLIGDHLGTVFDAAKKVASPIETARWALGEMTDESVSLASAAIALAGDLGTTGDEVDDLAGEATFLTSVAGDAGKALSDMQTSAGRGAQGLGELKDEIEENVDAVTDWADDVKASTESGAESFGDFSEDALGSIGAFQEELTTTSADVNAWQQNLITVAAATSPEFAGYLAEMGLAGAGLVEELAGNEGALETTLANYEMFAAVTSRDMVAEFAAVAPGVADELAKVEKAGVIALELARDGMMVEARRSKAVGTEMGNGVRSGIQEKAEAVAAAAAAMVRDAVTAAKNYARIKSPSRLFAEEVGQPIAQGVAEGIDEDASKVAEALTESIEGAEEVAVKAAQDLAEAVLDEFQALADGADDVLSGLFDEIDNADKLEGLHEAVSDSSTKLDDASANLAAVLADTGATSEEIAAAVEKESDAYESVSDAQRTLARASENLAAVRADSSSTAEEIEDAVERESDAIESLSDADRKLTEASEDLAAVRADMGATAKEIAGAIKAEEDAVDRLKDASMALTEATIANTLGTQEQQLAWLESAEAAGLTVEQIRALETAYKDAAVAQQALAVATANQDWVKGGAVNAISAEANYAKQVNDRFSEAGAAGLVMASDYKALAKLNGSPKQQIAMMESILARIEKFFAGVAKVNAFAKGTNNAPAGPAVINEMGAELVTLPGGAKVATAAASKELMAGDNTGGGADRGGGVNLTVNVGLGAGDGNQIGRQVVNAIKQYERSNGPGWRK
jgi:hypothetical protein